MSDELLTLRTLWAQTAEVIGARHEAKWLCEVAVSLDGDEFDRALDEPVTDRMVQHLDAMVARCRTGEPLQYVLGRWSFRGLDLAIDRRVLIPRPETEWVAGTAIELARAVDAPRRAADLGTGSGAIGLSMADELPLDGTEIWITDASTQALDVARANLAGVGRASRNVHVAGGSWFEALPPGMHFDVIVSNPPYVADASVDLDRSVSDHEPAAALFAGIDGLDDIRVLIDGAPDHLHPDGWLVIEIGADQGRAVLDLLNRCRYREATIRPDPAGRDRIAVARRPALKRQ